MRLLVGIDEVGRGPLAGPVSVGIVISTVEVSIAGLKDSKQMTALARERVCKEARQLEKDGLIQFGVFSTPSEKIDEWGIEKAVFSCITRGLRKLVSNPTNVKVFLDGRLKAPKEYEQEAIIRGDSLIPIISLASVIAKVTRDRFMKEKAHVQFPNYGFDSHKGYGTASHFSALRKWGMSPFHRRSFLSAL
jgi:ribonuclease HII